MSTGRHLGGASSAPSEDALRQLVVQEDYDAIGRLAAADIRVLSRLLSLTYAADEHLSDLSVEALGQAAARVAETDAEFVRNILRRLFWSLNDESGSIGWRAPQAIGAILSERSALFAEFLPILVSLLDLPERHFVPGVLSAISHVAARDAACLSCAVSAVRALLADPSPEIRSAAARCLAVFAVRAP